MHLSLTILAQNGLWYSNLLRYPSNLLIWNMRLLVSFFKHSLGSSWVDSINSMYQRLCLLCMLIDHPPVWRSILLPLLLGTRLAMIPAYLSSILQVVYGIFLSFGELGPGNCLGLLASKSSPTAVRGQFYGIAAAIGKVGAFIGIWSERSELYAFFTTPVNSLQSSPL